MAAVDVYETEPPERWEVEVPQELCDMPNVILTPHNGGATWQTATMIRSVQDLRGMLPKGPDSVRVSSFPSMAVDRGEGSRRGWIYIVYPEKTVTRPDIFLRSAGECSTKHIRW